MVQRRRYRFPPITWTFPSSFYPMPYLHGHPNPFISVSQRPFPSRFRAPQLRLLWHPFPSSVRLALSFVRSSPFASKSNSSLVYLRHTPPPPRAFVLSSFPSVLTSSHYHLGYPPYSYYLFCALRNHFPMLPHIRLQTYLYVSLPPAYRPLPFPHSSLYYFNLASASPARPTLLQATPTPLCSPLLLFFLLRIRPFSFVMIDSANEFGVEFGDGRLSLRISTLRGGFCDRLNAAQESAGRSGGGWEWAISISCP